MTSVDENVTSPTDETVASPANKNLSRLDKATAKYRAFCLSRGTYLADPSEEFAWFAGPMSSSYLIRASDAPSATTASDPDYRPAPVELLMICKVFPLLFC